MSRSASSSDPGAPDASGTDARLDAARVTAEEQLARLEAEFQDLIADDDTIQEDRDATRQLIEEARAAVANARRALERYRAGEYGRCEVCGNEIAPERLEALPDVTTCIDCQGRPG